MVPEALLEKLEPMHPVFRLLGSWRYYIGQKRHY